MPLRNRTTPKKGFPLKLHNELQCFHSSSFHRRPHDVRIYAAIKIEAKLKGNLKTKKQNKKTKKGNKIKEFEAMKIGFLSVSTH